MLIHTLTELFVPVVYCYLFQTPCQQIHQPQLVIGDHKMDDAHVCQLNSTKQQQNK